MPSFGAVRLNPLDELLGVTQRWRVTAVDLVGDDAEAIAHNTSDPWRGEEPVLTAQQISRRNVGPRSQRPRFLTWRLGLSPSLGERLGRQRRLDVVVENRQIVGIVLLLVRISGVREHRGVRVRQTPS